MPQPDPLAQARVLLPDQQIGAAGVFAVQDRVLAAGLLGAAQVAAAGTALLRDDPALRAYAPWLPTSVLVAVSPMSVHVLDWRPDTGASQELARFPRGSTHIAINASGTARRLMLTETRSGYRLPLTATTSRLHPYGAGARAVLAALTAPQAAVPGSQTDPVFGTPAAEESVPGA